MDVRKTPVQMLMILLAAAAIGIVANGFAANTRRLVLPGYWPNALRVPPREPERVPPPPRTETVAEETTTTIAPVVPPTTTTAAPPTTTTVATTTTATAPPPVTKTTTEPEKPAADPLARFQPHADKAYIEIGGDDAALLHAKGALFLDARRTAAYEEGHVAGARPFSVWEADVDDKVNRLFEERQDPASQNLPIVVYCTGGACEDSHMLSQKLWGVQFNNVYVYKDGFPDWQKRGGAIRKGDQP